MDGLLALSPGLWLFAITITAIAAFIKGAVGFAMPMVMISGLGSVFAPEVALAALILPTVASNVLQALRQGFRAAWEAVRAHWRFMAVGGVMLVGSAQLVRLFDERVLLALIGVPITLFGLSQLLGFQLRIGPERRTIAEVSIGAVAGFVGGLSGVWGPPTVAYLTALQTEKTEQIRVQGVIFGLGSILLTAAHLRSGVLNEATIPFSLALCVPALAFMWVGQQFQDRLDQDRFRYWTLVVLIIAGLNLIRRALF